MTPLVPDVVRARAIDAGAHAWLDDLPVLVESLEHDWAITVGQPLDGATEAFVATAATVEGTPAVLKLMVPRERYTAAQEITALRLAAGHGCVRLLRADATRSAMLLERLGAPMSEHDLPLDRRLDILTELAEQFWQVVPADAPLPNGADKAAWLLDLIPTAWARLGRPCSAAAIEHALVCARRRQAAHRDDRARLLHGDIHQWNALARETGWALIDPDGLRAEPEYDLGVLMREDPMELLRDGPLARARRLADRTGLDAAAIWEWGVVERVSTGLLAVSIGLEPVGHQMLVAADEVAGLYAD